MGQVALGFRSLFIKAAIFFAMATLLAWALGGTLWPRVVDYPEVRFGPAGATWAWEMRVRGWKPESVNWTLKRRTVHGDGDVLSGSWAGVVGPIVLDDRLYVAVREVGEDSGWRILVSEALGTLREASADEVTAASSALFSTP